MRFLQDTSSPLETLCWSISRRRRDFNCPRCCRNRLIDKNGGCQCTAWISRWYGTVRPLLYHLVSHFELDMLSLGSFLMSCVRSTRKTTKPHHLVIVPNGKLIYYIYFQFIYFDFSVVGPRLCLTLWISNGLILEWVRTSPLCLLNPLLLSLNLWALMATPVVMMLDRTLLL